MESKYRLVKVPTDDKWDKFIKTSPSGTIFASSSYLKTLGVNINSFFCYKKNELMAAVLCIVSRDGRDIEGHEHVIYDGLIYRDLSYLNKSQRYSEEFKIQEYVAVEIYNTYDKVFFKLHPSIVDIRPFLWVNYHSDSSGYKTQLRYTCYVDISDFSKGKQLNELELYKNASSARRQEVRYANKSGVMTTTTNNIPMFIELYKMTFDRQDVRVSNDSLKHMGFLLESLVRNNSCLMLQSSVKNGEVGSMAVFTLDGNVAYYLFGANNPSYRNKHTGTAVIWDAFYLLAEIGVSKVDLEGINSPRRGWFKTSFGGDVSQYFNVIKSNE